MKKIVIIALLFLAFFIITASIGSEIAMAGGCTDEGNCTTLDQDCCKLVNGQLVNGYCANKSGGGFTCKTFGGGGGGGGGGGATTGKCTCTAAYGACGNYLGQSNIKYRRCTANLGGASTCSIVDGVYYEYQSCNTATPTTPPASNKCTCSGAYSACGNYLQRTNVKYRQCTGSTTGTTNCEKVGGIFYDVVSCSTVPTVTPPTATRTPTPGGPTITPGGPTPAYCHYCTTAACGQCSNFASGWRCKCTGFNGSVYNSCLGVLDTTCGVAQPTPTGIPAGLCGYCTTAACNQCSTYASGWRCKCTGQVGNYFTTCAGELDTTCGVAQATPTPAACPQKIFGDADCDGKVTLKDYFYYVAKKAGVTLPASVNVDFNASGAVDDTDRNTVVKTLKP